MSALPAQKTNRSSLHCGCSTDDQELVALIRRGHGAAFDILCNRYEQRLFRIAARILRNQADAEDVVQESLLRAYTKIESFRGEAGIYTWLVRIVMNTSLMMLRKRARHPMTSLDQSDLAAGSGIEFFRDPRESPESAAIRQEESQILRTGLEQLPHTYRLLLSRWMFGTHSIQELSAELDLTVPATKSRLLRGRLKLKYAIERDVIGVSRPVF